MIKNLKESSGKNKAQVSPSNYEIANELPMSPEELKEKAEGTFFKDANGKPLIPKNQAETVPYDTYSKLKEQYYTALKDAEYYKRLWENAYIDPEKIPLWQCIKTKLFGSSNKVYSFRGLFGHFSVWNINNHRDSYPWNDRKTMKIRWIFHYLAPTFLSKNFESIDFYNIYDSSETGEKYTALVFAGTKNLYWLFFRKKDEHWGKENWHWCLKFKKTSNDHVSCG